MTGCEGAAWDVFELHARSYAGHLNAEDGVAITVDRCGATFAEARTAAGEAAVTVLGRLEVPGGGRQLAAALQGPRVLP